MTRAEKLAAVDANFLPIIATRTENVATAKANYENKVANLEEKVIQYNNKVAQVNTYYDAQDKILELQQLQEPGVNGD